MLDELGRAPRWRDDGDGMKSDFSAQGRCTVKKDLFMRTDVSAHVTLAPCRCKVNIMPCSGFCTCTPGEKRFNGRRTEEGRSMALSFELGPR